MLMAKEFSLIYRVRGMKGCGSMIFRTVMGSRSRKTNHDMRAFSKQAKNTVKASVTSLMVPATLASTEKIRLMARVCTCGWMVAVTQVSGRMMGWTEKVSLPFLMVGTILAVT